MLWRAVLAFFVGESCEDIPLGRSIGVWILGRWVVGVGHRLI